MVEFNPDGSIKLPDRFQKKKDENNLKLRTERCMKISKEIISFSPPKKCALHITLSDITNDNIFIETVFNQFRASVPMQLERINAKEFRITIGTDLRRCTDCTKLINAYKEFINVIEEKGSCTFQPRKFCHEDHFE